jgi:hypothetical protein
MLSENSPHLKSYFTPNNPTGQQQWEDFFGAAPLSYLKATYVFEPVQTPWPQGQARQPRRQTADLPGQEACQRSQKAGHATRAAGHVARPSGYVADTAGHVARSAGLLARTPGLLADELAKPPESLATWLEEFSL